MVSALIWLEAERIAEQLVELLRGVDEDALDEKGEMLRTMILIILTELEMRKARAKKPQVRRCLPEMN